MPNKFIPHYDRLIGYSFSVCRNLIDEMPVPRALRDIPSEFRDGLIATLVCELAAITSTLVIQGKRTMRELELEDLLLRRHGNPEYLRLLHQSDVIHRQQIAVLQERPRLERIEYWLCDKTMQRMHNTRIAVGLGGLMVRWRYDLNSEKTIDDFRRRLKKLDRDDAKLDKLSRSADAAVKRLAENIRQTVEYRDDRTKSRWVQVDVNFGSLPDFQSTGAAYHLRNGDFSWWQEFTGKFAAQVKRDSRRRPLKLALRDPGVQEEIDRRAGKLLNWDLAAADYFPGNNEWGVGKVTYRVICSMRGFLRDQDRANLEWLERRGRTANFYSQWLSDLDVQFEYRKRHFKLGSILNLKWLDSLRRRFVVGPVIEHTDWRLNELSWCLARGPENVYPFEPLISRAHGLEEWELYRKKWWAGIERAMSGSSPKLRT